jgi:hypothetical protein
MRAHKREREREGERQYWLLPVAMYIKCVEPFNALLDTMWRLNNKEAIGQEPIVLQYHTVSPTVIPTCIAGCQATIIHSFIHSYQPTVAMSEPMIRKSTNTVHPMIRIMPQVL